ncbi:phage tail tape measure protein [Sphingobacterium spiritivorum]|uniref:Phage tail tape measure protein, TP901 family n=1 Tax=Sphingobacterium spiritivorum ATCC 33861 TaxID=525373 RepID=D7VN64_SPHSI|nr:phage tail tape measure protein [Sphingobacterium spiritivorum]EFK57361.1 phage tail tape measure protein, TP901 family [Sphingobacterium spiritivorum ATCC 33861]QQT36559.1 phage tail tape measure protein [Sphingobacterium spiritivorum]WQD33310.1 phage tail tape measure protein [Sphingobacterium spiritivorum]SUJ22049.1 phage tail tape measure protein, TP901 family, core region [Sphingobacterium spiritivorum]
MADLRYKVVLDDTEARKKLRELLSNTGVGSSSNPKEDSKKSATTVDDVRNATLRLKEAQIANIESIRQARLEQAKQKQEQSELTTKFKEGQLTLQEFRLEQGKLNAARKEQSRIERELKKNLADNSEYAQLSKALNNVRRETKDLLAEMFKLERQGRSSSASYEMLKRKSEALTKQTQYLDKAIKRIDATVGQHQRNVGNYAQALENMSPIIARLNMNLALMGTSVSELAAGGAAGFTTLLSSVKSLGAGLASFLLTPVGAVIALLATLYSLIRAGGSVVIGFNSRLMSVSKTTGLAGVELNKFGDAIVELSRKLQVVSTDKLLEYATVAGQLGVKGRANLLAFAEALAKLETASDIKGEEGGTSIARTLTLVDGGVQNVKDFGDEIVNLGNNFAATEGEILSNAESIAQNTGVYKVGRRDVLAYAVATKAVGLEAEVVGSTFSRTLGEFEKMIRTGKGVADLSKVIGKSSQEISDQFKKDASSVFKDYINGLNRISLSGGSVNEALERTGVIAVRDQRVIATLATNGYATLSDALVKVGEAAGAMDREFETGASKLEQQLNRIGIAWDNFILSIEQGDGVLGKAAASIANLVANYADYMAKVINPSSFQEWKSRVSFANDEADAIREVTIGYKDAAETFAGLSGFNFSAANYDKLKEKYEEVGSSIKALQIVTEKYKTYVKDGLLTEGGQKRIEDYTKLIQNLSGSMWQIELFMKSRAPQATEKIDFEQSEEERRKAERAAEAARNKAEREAEARRQAMERQRALQLSIDQINEQSLRGQLSRDEQEVASIRDKYAKIREEVRKFYADPKNKGLKVDTGRLKGNEDFEISELQFRQGTKRISEDLAEQKALVDEYNNYLAKTSKEEADKRFSEQLSIIKNFKKNIQSEYEDLIALEKSASLSGFTGSASELTQAQKERADYYKKYLESLNKEERLRLQEEFVSALNLSKGHNQKLLDIEKKYNDARLVLGKNATKEQLEELNNRHNEEISAGVMAGLQKEVQWEKTFSTLQYLSKSATNKSLKDIQDRLNKELSSGNLIKEHYEDLIGQVNSARIELNLQKSWIASTDAIKAYIDLLRKAKKESKLEANIPVLKNEVFGALSSDIGNASQLVSTLTDSFATLGVGSEDLQETLGKVGGALGDLSNLAGAIATGNPVAIVTASIKALTSVIDIFNTKDKKLQKQIDKYQEQLYSLTKSYDRLQRSISNSVGESFYSDSEKAINNLKEQQQKLQDMAKAEEDKKKTDKDKAKSFRDEMDKIDQEIEDIRKSITESLVQTSFKELSNELADALVSAFEAGESAIDAMDDTFDKFIKNALANSLKLKMIEPIVNDMVNQVSQYMLANDNSLIGFNFDSWRDKLGEASKGFTNAMEEAYKGLGLSKDSSSTYSTSLSGAYARASQESIDLLAGQTGAMRSHLSELIQLQKNTDMTLKQCVDAAQSHLTQLILIERNTRVTADNASNYLPYLKGIEANTKGNLDMQLRAAGKFGF